MKKIILFALISVSFIACIDQAAKQSAKLEKLEEEVIKIHDEVMPKMADINRVKRTLKSIENDSTLNEVQVKEIRNNILALTKAEEGMSTWMAEYKAPEKDVDFEKAMQHLNSEKEKISEVRDQMLSSLKNGKALLDKRSNND